MRTTASERRPGGGRKGRGRRAALAPLALAWAVALGGAGCVAQEDQAQGRRFEGKDVPRCWARAHFHENRAIKAVESANRTDGTARKRELFDEAIGNFRTAIELYEQELLDDPGTPDKQQTLRDEIARLEDMLERTYKARPQEG